MVEPLGLLAGSEESVHSPGRWGWWGSAWSEPAPCPLDGPQAEYSCCRIWTNPWSALTPHYSELYEEWSKQCESRFKYVKDYSQCRSYTHGRLGCWTVSQLNLELRLIIISKNLKPSICVSVWQKSWGSHYAPVLYWILLYVQMHFYSYID